MVKRVLLCAVPDNRPCDGCYPDNPSIDLANKEDFAKLTQFQKEDLLIKDLESWYNLADLLKDFEQVDHVQLYQLYQYGIPHSKAPYSSSLEFLIDDINVQYDICINIKLIRPMQHILVDGSRGSRLEIYSEKKDTLFVLYFKTVHITRCHI